MVDRVVGVVAAGVVVVLSVVVVLRWAWWRAWWWEVLSLEVGGRGGGSGRTERGIRARSLAERRRKPNSAAGHHLGYTRLYRCMQTVSS